MPYRVNIGEYPVVRGGAAQYVPEDSQVNLVFSCRHAAGSCNGRRSRTSASTDQGGQRPCSGRCRGVAGRRTPRSNRGGAGAIAEARSEERSVGKECVSTGRSRGAA